jgi:SSS family solute:Na+ symporter
MVLAALVAPALKTLDQAYQFIQEYVGLFHRAFWPYSFWGSFEAHHFGSGYGWRLANYTVSTILKSSPAITNGAFPDYPFLDRMSITFY